MNIDGIVYELAVMWCSLVVSELRAALFGSFAFPSVTCSYLLLLLLEPTTVVLVLLFAADRIFVTYSHFIFSLSYYVEHRRLP